MIYEHDGITSEEQTHVVSIVIAVPLKSEDLMFWVILAQNCALLVLANSFVELHLFQVDLDTKNTHQIQANQGRKNGI